MRASLSNRLAVATLVALPLLAAARPRPLPLPEAKVHVVDKAHSEINFVADSRMLSAHGFFGAWDAEVKLDAANWSNSSVNITIDASSINTRNAQRDEHLRSPDFFDVTKHPTITFKSVTVKQTGANALAITGDFTMRGVTRRIVVPANLVFYEDGTGRFRGTFTIDRMEYGVSFDSRLNPIQKDVQVQWDIAVSAPKDGQ